MTTMGPLSHNGVIVLTKDVRMEHFGKTAGIWNTRPMNIQAKCLSPRYRRCVPPSLLVQNHASPLRYRHQFGSFWAVTMGVMATYNNVKEIIDKETMYFHVDNIPWKTVTVCQDAAKEILPPEGQEILLAHWKRDSYLIKPEDSEVEIWPPSIAPDFQDLPYPDRGTPSMEVHLVSFFNWVCGYLL